MNRERERERERQTDRQTDRDRDRNTESERDGQRETEKRVRERDNLSLLTEQHSTTTDLQLSEQTLGLDLIDIDQRLQQVI